MPSLARQRFSTDLRTRSLSYGCLLLIHKTPPPFLVSKTTVKLNSKPTLFVTSKDSGACANNHLPRTPAVCLAVHGPGRSKRAQ